MLDVEHELSKEFSLQLASDEVKRHDSLDELFTRATRESEDRIADLKVLLEQEGGSFGTAVKDGLAAITGTVSGLFGRPHERPLSRLVRDNLMILNFASASYAMMLTLGLAISHHNCTLFASRAIEEMPPLIVSLTDLLPLLVGEELAQSAPLASPAAVQIAGGMIRDAWRNA